MPQGTTIQSIQSHNFLSEFLRTLRHLHADIRRFLVLQLKAQPLLLLVQPRSLFHFLKLWKQFEQQIPPHRRYSMHRWLLNRPIQQCDRM